MRVCCFVACVLVVTQITSAASDLTTQERIRLTQIRKETGKVADKNDELAKEIKKVLRASNRERRRFGLKKVKLSIPRFSYIAHTTRTSDIRDWELREASEKLETYKQYSAKLEALLGKAKEAGEIDMTKVELTAKVLKEVLKDKGKGVRVETLVDDFRKLPAKEEKPKPKEGEEEEPTEREKLLKKYDGCRLQGDCIVKALADSVITAELVRQDPGRAETRCVAALTIKAFGDMAKDFGVGDEIYFDGILSKLQHLKDGNMKLELPQPCLVKCVRRARTTADDVLGKDKKPEKTEEPAKDK